MKVKVTFTLLMMLALLAASFGQTPGTVRFPSNLDTSVSLLEVSDRASTALSSSVTSGATTINVVSTSLFPATGILTIDDERVYYTSKTSTTFTIVRGQFGSTATTHASGAVVRMNVVARHHEALRDALIAVETKLGASASTPTTVGHVLTVTSSGQTAWQAPSASAILPVVDTQTVIKGSSDATKLLRFEVDGFTTATTRVATMPDANIVVAGSASALTSGRLPFVTASGLLTDSANAKLDSNGYLQAAYYFFTATGTSGSLITQAVSGSLLIQGSTGGGGGGDIVLQPAVTKSTSLNYSSGDWVYFGNGSGTIKTSIYQGERWSVGSTGATSSTGQFDIISNLASRIGLIVKGAASQSASTLEIQNSAGTRQLYHELNAGGASGRSRLGIVSIGTNEPVYLDLDANGTGGSFWRQTSGSGPMVFSNTSGDISFAPRGNSALLVAGVASAVNYLQVTNAVAAGRPIFSAVGSDTNISIEYRAKGTGTHLFASQAAGAIAVTVKGAASQSANLVEIQNSSSTILVSVNNAGRLGVGANASAVPNAATPVLDVTGEAAFRGYRTYFLDRDAQIRLGDRTTEGTYYFGLSGDVTDDFTLYDFASGLIALTSVQNSSPNRTYVGGRFGVTIDPTAAQFQVQGTNTSLPTSIFQAAASQSADLTQWRNSAGTVLAKVNSSGGSSWSSLIVSNPSDSATAILVQGSAKGFRLGTNASYGLIEAVDSTGVASYEPLVIGGSSIDFRISNNSIMSVASLGLTFTDTKNIVFGTTTGTKIGTSTSQKLAFYNATPIVQPNTTGTTVGFTAGAGTNVTDASTFTGNVGSTAYRISDIVKALKDLGLIAQ